MKKVWDTCICCFRDLEPASNEEWRRCTRCNCLEYIMKFFIFGSIATLWILAYKNNKFTSIILLNMTGLSFGMIGAWLLASGYLEIFSRAASGMGGGSKTFKRYGNRHYFKRLFGLFCLGFGFLVQAISLL